MPPCNCQNNTPPAGMAQRLQPSSVPQGTSGGTSPSSGTPGILTTPPVTSPQGQTQTFTLLSTDGRAQTFGSRLEADAARVRGGGGRIVQG